MACINIAGSVHADTQLTNIEIMDRVTSTQVALTSSGYIESTEHLFFDSLSIEKPSAMEKVGAHSPIKVMGSFRVHPWPWKI